MKTTAVFSPVVFPLLLLLVIQEPGTIGSVCIANTDETEHGPPHVAAIPVSVTPRSRDFAAIPSRTILTADTVITPIQLADSTAAKVVISNGAESLELTPLSRFNNGSLIQPVNRLTNKGISTAFYLADSSNWSFYTNGSERLSILGDGRIVASAPLLINNQPGAANALRVNGTASFDSAIVLQGQADNANLISLNRNVRYAGTEPDDGVSPYTLTPTGWANGRNIPVFRLRHPNAMIPGQDGLNTSLRKDFLILPYQYGTAIEYNGVVECWVGEWSIHRGLSYTDVEGNGNGWGGVLWVGDDADHGGVRATARNNAEQGGNMMYGELSVEKFGGESNGDFRLRLPSTANQFQFVYGGRGSSNVVAKLSDKGLVLPQVTGTATISSPEKAQLVYDKADNRFKAYDGATWTVVGATDMITGSFTASSNGVDNVYAITHHLPVLPAYFNVIASSADAAGVSYVTADASVIYIHYNSAPPAGIANLSWNWQVKPVN
jgi:hypothetical protein